MTWASSIFDYGLKVARYNCESFGNGLLYDFCAECSNYSFRDFLHDLAKVFDDRKIFGLCRLRKGEPSCKFKRTGAVAQFSGLETRKSRAYPFVPDVWINVRTTFQSFLGVKVFAESFLFLFVFIKPELFKSFKKRFCTMGIRSPFVERQI